jgi:hypothetical protein
VISALILFVAVGLLFRAWLRARRVGRPFLLNLEPGVRERRRIILAGTLIALSSLPVMLLAERLLPRNENLQVAVVTLYLVLASLGLIALFAKRQRSGRSRAQKTVND